MNTYQVEAKEKVKKESAKKAVALAMRSRWEEAVEVNRSILADFPRDLEAYNRLGKALGELGRSSEAKEAFQKALEISPYNTIARKNLDRLVRLGDEAPLPRASGAAPPQVFIEESGKAAVTSLVNLAPINLLMKLVPANPLRLQMGSSGLDVMAPSNEYIGQVEPRLGSRLIRLIKGGNRYEARVTSINEKEFTIIIREVHKDSSQAGVVSFPSKGQADYRVYLPGTLAGYDFGEDESEENEPVVVKDWSDDDTEPGDDDAFIPAFHRIIDGSEEVMEEDERDEED